MSPSLINAARRAYPYQIKCRVVSYIVPFRPVLWVGLDVDRHVRNERCTLRRSLHPSALLSVWASLSIWPDHFLRERERERDFGVAYILQLYFIIDVLLLAYFIYFLTFYSLIPHFLLAINFSATLLSFVMFCYFRH